MTPYQKKMTPEQLEKEWLAQDKILDYRNWLQDQVIRLRASAPEEDSGKMTAEEFYHHFYSTHESVGIFEADVPIFAEAYHQYRVSVGEPDRAAIEKQLIEHGFHPDEVICGVSLLDIVCDYALPSGKSAVVERVEGQNEK